jgi:hypothetical protein
VKIKVDRFVSDQDTTVSRVYVDGGFVCFGLEDEYRVQKLVDETRIPKGVYKVGLRTAGKHHVQYKAQFPDIHRGMLHILNVPNFEFILVHCGNTQADTSGCLLVGTGSATEPGNMSISSSRVAYRKFYPMVAGAAAGGNLTIEFQDNDR